MASCKNDRQGCQVVQGVGCHRKEHSEFPGDEELQESEDEEPWRKPRYKVEHGEDQGRDGGGAQEGHSAGGQGVRKDLAEQQLLDEWGENQ